MKLRRRISQAALATLIAISVGATPRPRLAQASEMAFRYTVAKKGDLRISLTRGYELELGARCATFTVQLGEASVAIPADVVRQLPAPRDVPLCMVESGHGTWFSVSFAGYEKTKLVRCYLDFEDGKFARLRRQIVDENRVD